MGANGQNLLIEPSMRWPKSTPFLTVEVIHDKTKPFFNAHTPA